MYQYLDSEETTLLVNGEKYGVVLKDSCEGCVFNSPTVKVLLPGMCSKLPCAEEERDTGNNVIFVEVPNGNP